MAPLRPGVDGPAGLVPIPLATRRLRQRGYNQSEVLARALGREWRIPVIPDVLVRTRETPTQTTLTPETRLANVAGAFSAVELGGRLTPGRRPGVSRSHNCRKQCLLDVETILGFVPHA